MKKIIFAVMMLCWTMGMVAQTGSRQAGSRFGKGQIIVKKVARNAVRIRYQESSAGDTLPDWLYVRHGEVDNCDVKVDIDRKAQTVTLSDQRGHTLFRATRHELMQGGATLAFDSPSDECLFGLGQFQDGYANVRGLSRRLTQVNTQISLPMLLSSKGYGILWNNYGLTEFNPCRHSVKLARSQGAGRQEVVNVTSTEGGKQEVREQHVFEADLNITESGDYALLLDVGQKMARRHNLTIDGKTVIEMQNVWLPPTASTIVRLEAGRHQLRAELSNGDDPTLYYNKVEDHTVFHSPVATAVDYTVFMGSADEVIATYRDLTGKAPLMPDWALGYIHCRERFHSSDEILATARRFRSEQLPLSMIVQDWQYWGKHGWNSMTFDEDYYPDPKALTDSLHQMDVRLMLSVWSKIDRQSEVGRQMAREGHYIPGTDWIDFFSPQAARAYWQNFSQRLLPLGIDAWWQDATEPENDDLEGRRVNHGRWSGEEVRNVYPLLVNKTVYEGLLAAGREPMILTRSGFPGIQRYGSALWSGDVGNDWETLRRQIIAGLGVQAAGIPWWTYDAGGFFRPQNQYTDSAYIERMLRWIETSVYLPLMRVHGYMSNTEPWNYGPEAQAIIADCLREREQLRPYIKECARRISEEGYTMMRPLIFDFADDPEALQQSCEYMFGPLLLVSPVTKPGVSEWQTYLPKSEGGWTDHRTGQHYEGGQTVTTQVDKGHIPVFERVSAKAALGNIPILMLGSWSGKLKVGTMALTLVLHLEQADGKTVATLDSPDQGAKGIGCTLEYLSGDSVAVKVETIGAVYRGKLRDGKLCGTFSQNGLSVPLELTKGMPKVKRPQRPVPPYPYETEEVTFRNEADGATLSGTLTYPVGYDKRAKQKPAVVLLVTGSGQQNRDEEIFNHSPFLVIADYLARQGIASLRYDDRATGASTGGELKNATTEDFMRDAAAGMQYLHSRKDFAKVGCLGHSEGGAIAFMLGAQKKADFIVSLAGPGVKGDTLLVAQVNSIQASQGMKANMTVDSYRQQQAVNQMPWLQWFIDYDPSDNIRRTRCPVFALNGDRDCQVISSLNLTAIKRLLPASKKNLVKEYPSLNHLFQHCTTGLPAEYGQIEETISPEVLADVATWIKGLK